MTIPEVTTEALAPPDDEEGLLATSKLDSESLRFKIGLAKEISSELFLRIGLGKTGFSLTLLCSSRSVFESVLLVFLSCKVKDEERVLTLGFGGSLKGLPVMDFRGFGTGTCFFLLFLSW